MYNVVHSMLHSCHVRSTYGEAVASALVEYIFSSIYETCNVLLIELDS